MCVTGVEADSGQAQRDQFSPYPNGRRPGLQSHARDLTDNVSPHGGGDRACSARSPFTEHGPSLELNGLLGCAQLIPEPRRRRQPLLALARP
jgi:hypothetical protein